MKASLLILPCVLVGCLPIDSHEQLPYSSESLEVQISNVFDIDEVESAFRARFPPGTDVGELIQVLETTTVGEGFRYIVADDHIATQIQWRHQGITSYVQVGFRIEDGKVDSISAFGTNIPISR